MIEYAQDNTGANVISNNAVITVNSDSMISLSPTTNAIDAGQSVIFTNSTSGGTPPYSSYAYTVNSMSGVSITGNTITFNNAGTFNVLESVTDSADYTVSSLNSVITVNVVQTAGLLTESNTVIDPGQYSTLTAGSTTGGTPPYK